MRLRITAPNGSSTEQQVSGAAIRLGRDPAAEVPFDAAVYPQVSGQHARIDRTGDTMLLVPLSRSNKTLLNGEPIDGPAALNWGDQIRLGYSGPTIEVLAPEPPRPRSTSTSPGSASAVPRAKLTADAAPSGSGSVAPVRPASHGAAPVSSPAQSGGDFSATMEAGPQHLALLRGSVGSKPMAIGKGGIIGRAEGQVAFFLDHSQVSRFHAKLLVDRNGDVALKDLGSANGTYVNGRSISRRVALQVGDRIDIGPFSLTFDGDAIISRSRSNNIELVAHSVQRVVTDRLTGKPLTLLDDVSLVVRPREFVCLLGPSGSGKSTLLAILSGRNAPNGGKIRVNGEDLYENFAALKQDIAVVPQKEVLHESLSVGAALGYTAELRLPPDTGGEEITGSVKNMLDVVGLKKRRGTLIRNLSGGQLKRASLANELMGRPSLLFLDEVTSGLDEQTDREMMELFRQVADNGKTVVCITHSLANVEANCHLVVILTEGGRLAFVGSPDEARRYFGIDRLGDVYKKLAERTPPEWQKAFEASLFHARYVRDRLPSDADEGEPDARGRRSAARISVNPLRQAWILTRRSVAIWRGDSMALLAMAAQAFMVAMMLGILFGILDDKSFADRVGATRALLFLLGVSCFWFGCNNAAKEIVKERVIFSRERDFNLRIDSYYASKFIILSLIALAQVTVLFLVVRVWCGPEGAVPLQWFALATLAVAGTTLGLAVSTFARTEEVAVALVPLVVIPQIVLAGVIAPLSGFGEVLAKTFITVYWGQRTLEALLPDSMLSVLPDEPSYLPNLAVVSVHLGTFVVVTMAYLWWQGRRGNRG